ncbi:hypothetical protein, partial [Legionella maioricensis]
LRLVRRIQSATPLLDAANKPAHRHYAMLSCKKKHKQIAQRSNVGWADKPSVFMQIICSYP